MTRLPRWSPEHIMKSKWAVGFNDRGLGRGDYGVITENGELVVACPSLEIAEHIVELHNGQSKASRRRKARPKDEKG